VACNPTSEDGERGCADERADVEGQLRLEGQVHGGAGFDRPRDDIRKEESDGAGDETQNGELDGEDGRDAGAGGSKRLEHHDLADATIAGSGNRGREDDDSGEDRESGEKLDHVDDLNDDGADAFNDGATLMIVTVG